MPLFERDRYQRLPLDVSSAGGGAGAGGGGARRPASSCASATIILFVGLCLVGAWMMASTTTSNVAVSVSSENKGEDDRSADLTRSVVNGGKVDDDAPADTTQTGDAAGAGVTGKKDDGGSVQTTEAAAGNDGRERQQAEGGGGEGDTPHTTENAGKEDEDGPGDTPQTGDAAAGDTDKKDDDGGAARTTEDAVDQSSIVVVEPTDAAANGTTEDRPNGDTVVGAGELPSKNVTFSDESGMMEEGDVAKPDDTDKKAQNGTEEATTGVQTDKSAEDAATSTDQKGGNNGEQNTEEAPRDTTNTGDQVDKSSDGASSETGGQEEKKEETGGQADNITDKSSAEDTPAFAKDAGDDGTAKNQTAFDDHNGNLDGNQNGDKVTGDDTAASNNQTAVDHKDAPKNQTSAALNDTIFQEAGMVPTNSSVTTTEDEEVTEPVTGGNAEAAELLPSGQAELLNETTTAAAQNGTFPTQATESREEKKKKKEAHGSSSNKNKNSSISNSNGSVVVGETSTEESSYVWKLCNASTGADYIPCLDNEAAIRRLRSTKHYEHRERHCPSPAPSCLVPLPEGYRRPIPWPNSRDRIWYNNVPNTKLASFKGHQNWVKVSGDGEHLEFPGGGTQFLNGASHYIYVIQEALPAVAWGTRSRVVLDVGCGVASFGGYLFDKDALTMSFAPKDEHEAQVQFALERGIPAISAVMGTKRLPFPSCTFDVVHCARCRVPWHIEGGKLLLEVNRLLRPGGLFVWSATPVYRKDEENVGIWQAMVALTKSMCWEMVTRTSDTVDQTALVIFKKPSSNDCYGKRSHPEPALCEESDNPNAAWNITLQACMHRVPTNAASRGSRWPAQWPERLTTAPYWLVDSQVGVYGKPAPDDFSADTEHWRKAVNSSYLTGMGIDWSNVRNVMDMRSVYGGFAAALLLLRDMKVWVMNVVPVDSPDTLPIIYERGLFGMYHDWCESFSTYPRSYDLVHADHLFSKLKYRCKVRLVIAEVDRILRPEGKMIVREDRETAEEVERISKSLHWEVRMDVSKEGERLLCFQKTMWRPTQVEALS